MIIYVEGNYKGVWGARKVAGAEGGMDGTGEGSNMWERKALMLEGLFGK